MKKVLITSLALFSFNANAIDPNFSGSQGLTIPTVTIDEVEAIHNVSLSIIEGRTPLSFELQNFNPSANSMVRSITLLNGGSETTPVTTEGAGIGRFKVNLETGAITGFVHTRDLTDITAAHIHQGAKGADGSAIITLVGEGNFMFIPKGTVLNTEQLEAFKNSSLYVNVHTTANPSGEIRGQLPNGNRRFASANLSGSQEVPPVTSDAKGTAFMSVNLNTGRLVGYVQIEGMTVAAAHIHTGKTGQNGGVFITLDKVPTNNTDMTIVNYSPLKGRA